MDADQTLKPARQRSGPDGTIDAVGAGGKKPAGGSLTASTRWLWWIAIAAALAVIGAYAPLPWLHYMAKPLTTLLVVAMACRARPEVRGYRNAIVVGLLLSTFGDVFLMLPGDFFVHGLASFLLAHLAYLFAFAHRERLFARAWPLVAYAAMAGTVLTALWPGLPQALRLPVIVYVVVLAAMAAQAVVVWRLRRDRPSMLAAAGGLFFVASDSMLAIDRFAAPFAAATLAVLATYWIAQSLIGLSVVPRAAR